MQLDKIWVLYADGELVNKRLYCFDIDYKYFFYIGRNNNIAVNIDKLNFAYKRYLGPFTYFTRKGKVILRVQRKIG